MLINCPRCGLSQPNDQYCAQCGVDMQLFKPKEEPFLTKLVGNAVLQIAVLFVAAIFVGQYVFHSREPQNWVQKITHFKGLSKSEKSGPSSASAIEADSENTPAPEKESSSAVAGAQPESLRARELNLNRTSEISSADPAQANSLAVAGRAQDLSSMNFKITYAEVTTDMLLKWVTDSSNLGLYQNLQDYSAGIIYDFKKRGDRYHQKLKTSDMKLSLGSINSSLSGIMSEDGSQMLGLITAIEYKSNDNEIIHGNISVTRSGNPTNYIYPAEFSLPRGAVFFMIGAIKRGGPPAEQAKLDMPPFQIFKSPDFMTRKTEFVIILEPDYK